MVVSNQKKRSLICYSCKSDQSVNVYIEFSVIFLNSTIGSHFHVIALPVLFQSACPSVSYRVDLGTCTTGQDSLTSSIVIFASLLVVDVWNIRRIAE